MPETILAENIGEIESNLTENHILKPVYSRFGENVIMNPNISKLDIDVSKTNPWILQRKRLPNCWKERQTQRGKKIAPFKGLVI